MLRDIYFRQEPGYEPDDPVGLKRDGDDRGNFARTGLVHIGVKDIKAYHPLFQKLSDDAMELVLSKCFLIRLKKDQVLYKQGDSSNGCGYLILYGFVELADSQKPGRTFGSLTMGDSVGEESLLNVQSAAQNPSSVHLDKEKLFAPHTKRLETVIARSETFLFEIQWHSYQSLGSQMGGILKASNYLQMDWFTL